MSDWRTVVANNDRYKNFSIFDSPVSFRETFKGRDIPYVQFHSVQTIGDNDIIGFCGTCKWAGNKFIPVYRESYEEDIPIFGYDWFKYEQNRDCLDVLVGEIW